MSTSCGSSVEAEGSPETAEATSKGRKLPVMLGLLMVILSSTWVMLEDFA